MTLKELKNISAELPKTPRLPVLFFGHGSPQNALENNSFTRDWEAMGKKIPRPHAVLCISAHWYTDNTFVHVSPAPQTIHDFYGFPPELYSLHYPCPGSPSGASIVEQTVHSTKVQLDTDWGLDHGAWVVLRRLFPQADVPVFQLSIDATKPPQFHYDLGRELMSLRERGILIVGSGNIVHNLGLITFDEAAPPYDWATEFDELSKKLIQAGDHQKLIDYKKLGTAAHHSIPTPDHYYPLLYTLGLQAPGETVSFFAEGITYQSISMRSLIIQ